MVGGDGYAQAELSPSHRRLNYYPHSTLGRSSCSESKFRRSLYHTEQAAQFHRKRNCPRSLFDVYLPFVMSPQTDNLYNFFLFINFIHQAMFEINPTGNKYGKQVHLNHRRAFHSEAAFDKDFPVLIESVPLPSHPDGLILVLEYLLKLFLCKQFDTYSPSDSFFRNSFR